MSRIAEIRERAESEPPANGNAAWATQRNIDTRYLLSHITAIEAEKAALSKKVRELTTLLDAQLGTPCEQIRHQQEVEELKADRDRMREALEKMSLKYGHAVASASFQDVELDPRIARARDLMKKTNA